MLASVNIPDNLNAVDFEDISVAGTAVGVTASKLKRGGGGVDSLPATVRAALITCNTNAIRFRVDGAAAPTATLGHRLAPGQELVLMGSANIARLQMIQESAGSNVSVTFFA